MLFADSQFTKNSWSQKLRIERVYYILIISYFTEPQVIKPKEFQLKQNMIIEGFGYTFSNQGIDVDANGFPDFGVGAPLANIGSVVLLRTIPVFIFDVTASVTYEKPKNENDQSKILLFLVHRTVVM